MLSPQLIRCSRRLTSHSHIILFAPLNPSSTERSFFPRQSIHTVVELSLLAVGRSNDRVSGKMAKSKTDKKIAYDRQRGDVLVALGVDNPKLYHTHLTVRADRMSWVAGQPPSGILDQLAALRKLSRRSRDGVCSNSSTSTESGHRSSSSHIRSNDDDGISVERDLVTVGEGGNDPMVKEIEVKAFTCDFRARYQHKMGVCSITVRLLPASTTLTSVSKSHSALLHKRVVATAFPSHQQDLVSGQDDNMEVLSEVDEVGEDYVLDVVFHEARRAITPGQILALYLGDDCLGGGIIS